MEEKAGAQISRKAFIQSILILLVLMILAGILTRTIPAGAYQRTYLDGREMVIPDSFHYTNNPDYPIWRWFTAPIEVLWGPDNATIIVILIFLLLIGGAFAVLDKTGILKTALVRIVHRLGNRKYLLLLAVTLFFMLLGAFFGIFEEVVPLVPLMIALSYLLGWDSLIGLGMSILATNIGFSAAITNPFTIGVAQKLAGLPLFSGSGLRIIIFIVFYLILAAFLINYAKKIEKSPQSSLVYQEDQEAKPRFTTLDLNQNHMTPAMKRAIVWFAACLIFILTILIASPFIPAISAYSLPLIGILFFIGAIGAGRLSGTSLRTVFSAALEGMAGIAPGIPLILMASSVKMIVYKGGILDTLLFKASASFSNASPFLSVILILGLSLFLEFFISSGSAKAFLLMPILLPLTDLVGISRQLTVLAYCFGDGFSNLAYPTSAVLLISLGLTVVSYPKWLRWTLKLWGVVAIAVLAFLGLGILIHYGPF